MGRKELVEAMIKFTEPSLSKQKEFREFILYNVKKKLEDELFIRIKDKLTETLMGYREYTVEDIVKVIVVVFSEELVAISVRCNDIRKSFRCEVYLDSEVACNTSLTYTDDFELNTVLNLLNDTEY